MPEFMSPQLDLGFGYNRKYKSSPNGAGQSYGLMYGATSPAGYDVIDKMISKQLAQMGTHRLKGEMMRQQAEAEQKMRTEQLRQQEIQKQGQQIGAASQAVKTGVSLLNKPSTQSAPDTTGGVVQSTMSTPKTPVSTDTLGQSTNAQPVATPSSEMVSGAPSGQNQIRESNIAEAGNLLNQEISTATQKIDVNNAQLENIKSAMEKAAKDQDVDKFESLQKQAQELQGTQQSIAGRVKSMASNVIPTLMSGAGLYTDLSGALKDPNWQNVGGAVTNAGKLTGNVLDMAGKGFGSPAIQGIGETVGKGAGAVSGALGLAKGAYDISQNPKNQAGYTNLGIGAVNTAASLAPTTAAAGTGATTAAVDTGVGATVGGAASTVAYPLAAVAAAEGLRGAFGGVGKSYENQSVKESQFNTPATSGLLPASRGASGGYKSAGQMVSGGERIAMAPINWLFGDNTAFDGQAWDDLISGFKGIF